MHRITDAIIAAKPRQIAIAGGEPLLVPGVFDIGRSIKQAGISAAIWTGGWNFKPDMVDNLIEAYDVVHVSVDGATAEVHDRIRGRKGSLDRALAALDRLDEASKQRRANGLDPVSYGVDWVVTKSNFHQLHDFCRLVAARYEDLAFVYFNAALPIGLAARAGFATHELPTEDQAAALGADEYVAELRSLVPPTMQIITQDYTDAHPYLTDGNPDYTFMEVEPDGGVRAFPYYEGTVGNILEEPAPALWQKAKERRNDPFVRDAFSRVRTMADWAEAVRRIDYHFGSAAVRARLDRRPAYVPAEAVRADRLIPLFPAQFTR
jgi:hypothetical protein